ncbi:unnamed protein product, partial [Prorocentrum cordatum]
MPPPGVNSVNGPRGSSNCKGKKKEQTEARRRANRRIRRWASSEQLGDHQQWTYAATGAPVPQCMTRGQRSWAAAMVFWLSKLADEFGGVMINRRFWPTNLVMRMRVIPQQFYTCRRMPIHVEFGSNGHGRWWVRGLGTMRVAYQDTKPDKSTPKKKMTCACKRQTAACSLRGKGFAQLGGSDPEWQALVAAPAPPPGVPAARASAGAVPPWPASADAQAAGTPYQQIESEQPDVIMHDVEEQAKEQRAQRRRQAAPSPAKRAAMGPSASSGDGNDETMRLLQQIANKQNQQESSINQLCATVSGQMEAVATPQSKAQQLSAHSSTAQVLTGPAATKSPPPLVPRGPVPRAPREPAPKAPQAPGQKSEAEVSSPEASASAKHEEPGQGPAAARPPPAPAGAEHHSIATPPALQQPPPLQTPPHGVSIAAMPSPRCGTPSAAAAATQEGGWGFVGTAPVVSAYPSYGAGPVTHQISSAAWPPPMGYAKTRVDNPRGLRDQQGALLSSPAISSFAMPSTPGGTQQQPPATAPAASAQQLTRAQSGPMQDGGQQSQQRVERPTRPSAAGPSSAEGDPWMPTENPEEAAWRQQQQMKGAEKERLAKEGWEQTGWKTWSHEGGGKIAHYSDHARAVCLGSFDKAALEQHQLGRKFAFEHPVTAGSWRTEMVRYMQGFPGAAPAVEADGGAAAEEGEAVFMAAARDAWRGGRRRNKGDQKTEEGLQGQGAGLRELMLLVSKRALGNAKRCACWRAAILQEAESGANMINTKKLSEDIKTCEGLRRAAAIFEATHPAGYMEKELQGWTEWLQAHLKMQTEVKRKNAELQAACARKDAGWAKKQRLDLELSGLLDELGERERLGEGPSPEQARRLEQTRAESDQAREDYAEPAEVISAAMKQVRGFAGECSAERAYAGGDPELRAALGHAVRVSTCGWFISAGAAICHSVNKAEVELDRAAGRPVTSTPGLTSGFLQLPACMAGNAFDPEETFDPAAPFQDAWHPKDAAASPASCEAREVVFFPRETEAEGAIVPPDTNQAGTELVREGQIPLDDRLAEARLPEPPPEGTPVEDELASIRSRLEEVRRMLAREGASAAG